MDLGGCQNYGLFLGTLNIRCRIIKGIQKGTIILTTTHLKFQDLRPSSSSGSLRRLKLKSAGFRVLGVWV